MKGRSSSFTLFATPASDFSTDWGRPGARDQCVLKGASLLAVWMEEPYRATRDIDILAFGANDEETVRGVMSTVCNVPCPEDGLLFDR